LGPIEIWKLVSDSGYFGENVWCLGRRSETTCVIYLPSQISFPIWNCLNDYIVNTRIVKT